MRHSKTAGIHRYKREGTTYYRVSIRFRGYHGEVRRYRESGFRTREQAEQAIAKARALALQPPRRDLKPLSVEEAWCLYSPVAERDNRSFASDKGRAAHLLRHMGPMEVSTLNLGAIDDYRARRTAELKKRRNEAGVFVEKPPSPAQLDREVELLKRFLNYCVEAGRLDSNPVSPVRLLRKPNTRSMVLSEEEFQLLLGQCDEVLRPILLIAYDHGLRKREVLDLCWNQVDVAEGRLVLREQDTKTHQAREIYLTQRTIEALKRFPRGHGDTPVFPNPKTRKPWIDIRRMVSRAAKAVGIAGLWFHDTRRSALTNARRRGVPETVVMRMSGHKTRSAFARYNIIDGADLKAAVRQIEAGQTVTRPVLGHESAPSTTKNE